MKFSIAFVALALCLAGVTVASPGLKLAATPAIFNDFAKNFVPQLLDQLGPIKVPDTKLVGFNIKDITLHKMTLSGKDTQITFAEGHGALSASNFGLRMTFFIEGKVFGLIPVHFTTGGTSNQSELHLDIAFGYKDSFVQINLKDLKLQIRNLVMEFPKDTLGNIVSAITNLLRDPIQDTVSFLVSDVLKGVIQNVINNLFTQIPKVGPIPGTPLGVNFQATQMPVINSKYVLAHINGTFFNLEKGFFIPSVDPPVDTPDFDEVSNKTVQAVITEYTINTLMDGFWKSGIMGGNVTQDIIPKEAGLKLTVGWLKQFIPNISQYFPNDNNELILNIVVNSAPVLKITPGDIGVTMGLALTFYVKKDDATVAQAVSVSSTINLHANATIDSWVLKPYIIGGSFGAFTILSSQVGDFDPSKFQAGLNIILMFALPGFNFAQPAFPLPAVPGVNVTSLTLDTQPGYLKVQVSPTFTTVNIKELLQQDFSLNDYAVPFDESVYEEMYAAELEYFGF